MAMKEELDQIQADAYEKLVAELSLHAPREMVKGCACGAAAFGPMHIADVVAGRFELLVKPLEGYISVWEIAHKSTADIMKEHEAWANRHPEER